MEKDFYKSESERYSNTLRLGNYRSDYHHHSYKDVAKAIQLLRQIFSLSKTEEGRTQIYNIQPSIISYYLIQAVNTRWYVREYFQVDNLCLKILALLVTDPRFFRDAAIAKTDIIRLIHRNSGKVFVDLCVEVLTNITTAEKKKMLETPLEVYRSQFTSKEEAIQEMHKHKDFYNFSGSSVHFNEEFPLYINMLRGALKVGAKKEVICRFPKDCFGCVIFSMVSGGYRTKQKQLSVTFLSELTEGWITQTFYDIMQSKMKALFRHLRRNEDLQDKYELVCLRFTEYDRSIYNYLQKLSRKDRNGQLAASRKILDYDQFNQETTRLKIQDKLSDQRSDISRNYRKKSESSKSFMDISQMVTPEQANFIKEAVFQQMEWQGVKLKKLTLRYAHEESMRRYNLSSMLSCSSHNIFVARDREGRSFAGYFISPSTYYGLIGKALLFTFEPNMTFKLRDLIESPKIISKRRKQSEDNEKMEHLSKQQDEQQRLKYQKMKQWQRYHRIDMQDICESENEGGIDSSASHQLQLRADNRIFNIMLQVKAQAQHENDDPWVRFKETFKCQLDSQPNISSLTMDIEDFQFYGLETEKLPK